MVEKNVQDSRRRIWLDAQKIRWGSFADLNAWLGERCRALWGELRHPELKGFSVLEMLEQERLELMPMPSPFDGYVEKPARASSTCPVSVARNWLLFHLLSKPSTPWSSPAANTKATTRTLPVVEDCTPWLSERSNSTVTH